MNDTKISENFGARLRRIGPGKKVRATVIMKTAPGAKAATRARKVRTIRESAAASLHEIDAVLERHQGRRLADAPDALGYIPVETTPAGIRALAESPHVRAILENQPVSLAR